MSELHERWAVTRALLGDARRLFGVEKEVPPDFDGWLYEHNELGLAFDVLVVASDETNSPRPVWEALAQAAESMNLTPEDSTHGASAATVVEHLANLDPGQ